MRLVPFTANPGWCLLAADKVRGYVRGFMPLRSPRLLFRQWRLQPILNRPVERFIEIAQPRIQISHFELLFRRETSGTFGS